MNICLFFGFEYYYLLVRLMVWGFAFFVVMMFFGYIVMECLGRMNICLFFGFEYYYLLVRLMVWCCIEISRVFCEIVLCVSLVYCR